MPEEFPDAVGGEDLATDPDVPAEVAGMRVYVCRPEGVLPLPPPA